MKTETVIRQMEEFVQDFRAQLQKNDPASVKVLTSNTKRFFDDLEDALPQDVDLGGQIHEFQACAERFGKACENRDVDNASKALEEMEAVVKTLQQQFEPQYSA